MTTLDNAALLARLWNEARTTFRADQARVDLNRFDSLAKLVARVHRARCEQQCSREMFEFREAA
jgi:hypothetical protein